MNRSLSVERVYSLSAYNTLRVVDQINDLPEEFISNTKAVDLVRYLQLIGSDLVYERYTHLMRQTDDLTVKERVAYLVEERANTMDLLKQIIESTKENTNA